MRTRLSFTILWTMPLVVAPPNCSRQSACWSGGFGVMSASKKTVPYAALLMERQYGSRLRYNWLDTFQLLESPSRLNILHEHVGNYDLLPFVAMVSSG